MSAIPAVVALKLEPISATTSSSCSISYKNSTTLFCKSNYYDVSSLSHISTKKPPSNITRSFTEDFFMDKFDFSPEIASKLASASALMRNPQNPYLLLSFLKERGFSHSHLERIVRHHPVVLSACVETSVKPKFKIFQDLGFSAAEVTRLIARDFTILYRGTNTIIRSLSVLKGLLGSTDRVMKLIKKCHTLFYVDPENTILPNIEFLKSCGVQIEQINSLMYAYPGLLLKSPENMRRCVHKCDEMGVDRNSRMFIYAVQTVSTMSYETLELKFKSFQELGFSEEEILRVFRSEPLVIAASTRKINEVKEVLLETGKYDMSSIVKCPASLMRSVEKRYKPRLQVLKVLERKGLITKWPSLSTLGSMTDERFFKRFVAPSINEVGEAFIAMTAVSGEVEAATGLKAKLR